MLIAAFFHVLSHTHMLIRVLKKHSFVFKFLYYIIIIRLCFDVWQKNAMNVLKIYNKTWKVQF